MTNDGLYINCGIMYQIEAAFKEALTERQYQALVAVALRGVPMDVVAERMGTNRNALYKLIHEQQTIG